MQALRSNGTTEVKGFICICFSWMWLIQFMLQTIYKWIGGIHMLPVTEAYRQGVRERQLRARMGTRHKLETDRDHQCKASVGREECLHLTNMLAAH